MKNVMDIIDIDIEVLAVLVVPISIPLISISASVPWGLGDILMVEERLVWCFAKIEH